MDLSSNSEAEDAYITINQQELSMLRQCEIGTEPLQELPQNTAAAENLIKLREQIVDLMPTYPALWNSSLRAYRDLNKKDAAWKELSDQLNETGMFKSLFPQICI